MAWKARLALLAASLWWGSLGRDRLPGGAAAVRERASPAVAGNLAGHLFSGQSWLSLALRRRAVDVGARCRGHARAWLGPRRHWSSCWRGCSLRCCRSSRLRRTSWRARTWRCGRHRHRGAARSRAQLGRPQPWRSCCGVVDTSCRTPWTPRPGIRSAQSARGFFTDFCLGLAFLTLPPVVSRWLPSTRTRLTSGRWPPRLEFLTTLNSRGPGLAVLVLGLSFFGLGRHRTSSLPMCWMGAAPSLSLSSLVHGFRAARGRRRARGP